MIEKIKALDRVIEVRDNKEELVIFFTTPAGKKRSIASQKPVNEYFYNAFIREYTH